MYLTADENRTYLEDTVKLDESIISCDVGPSSILKNSQFAGLYSLQPQVLDQIKNDMQFKQVFKGFKVSP